MMKLQILGITGNVQTTLDIGPNDTFKDVKAKIMDKCGIPPCLQILSFQGVELEEDFVVLDLESDRLTLVQKNTCGGGGCMQIFFKMEDGRVVPLAVHTYDILRHVKMKLEMKTGIKVDDQQIIFKDQKLKNGLTLAEYHVVNKSALLLLRRRTVKITVKMVDGLVFTVNRVDPTDMVKKLKGNIADEEGIPAEEQRLIFQDDLLEDDRQLRQYNIRDGSIIWLIRSTDSPSPAKKKCYSSIKHVNMPGTSTEPPKKYQIFVKMLTGETLTFLVHGSMTMKDVKKMMLEKEGIPIENQRYVFGGRPLEDGPTLFSYKILKENLIHLVVKVCGC